MGKATGLRFSESLSGYLGEGADFWEAYHNGRARGGAARFWATVSIPDLDRFLADPAHEAALAGRLAIAALGSAPVEDGLIHLFHRREQERLLLYCLPFTKNAERYLLRGEKRVHGGRGLDTWRQMTTLYTELVRQREGGAEEVLGRGVLRIGPGQVLLQALSFRPLGTLSPGRALSNYLRFLRFASREIGGAGENRRS